MNLWQVFKDVIILRYLSVGQSQASSPLSSSLHSFSNLVSSVLCLFSASWRHRSLCILLIKIPSSRVLYLCRVAAGLQIETESTKNQQRQQQ